MAGHVVVRHAGDVRDEPTGSPETDPIETYLADLGSRLRGPRRVKADLIAEAHDGLLDAADAYTDAGHTPSRAARSAVTDFGTVDRIAPHYQRELAFAQGRRAVSAFWFVHLGSVLAGQVGCRILDLWGPPPTTMTVSSVLSGAVFAICVVSGAIGLAAYRTAARRPGTTRRVVRLTAIALFGITADKLIAALTPGVVEFTTTGAVYAPAAGAIWFALLCLAPLGYLTLLGVGCLRTARTVTT